MISHLFDEDRALVRSFVQLTTTIFSTTTHPTFPPSTQTEPPRKKPLAPPQRRMGRVGVSKPGSRRDIPHSGQPWMKQEGNLKAPTPTGSLLRPVTRDVIVMMAFYRIVRPVFSHSRSYFTGGKIRQATPCCPFPVPNSPRTEHFLFMLQ